MTVQWFPGHMAKARLTGGAVDAAAAGAEGTRFVGQHGFHLKPQYTVPPPPAQGRLRAAKDVL